MVFDNVLYSKVANIYKTSSTIKTSSSLPNLSSKPLSGLYDFVPVWKILS